MVLTPQPYSERKGLPMMLWCDVIVFHNRRFHKPDVSRLKSLDFRVQFLTLFRLLGGYFCFPCLLYVFNYPFNRSWSIIRVNNQGNKILICGRGLKWFILLRLKTIRGTKINVLSERGGEQRYTVTMIKLFSSYNGSEDMKLSG